MEDPEGPMEVVKLQLKMKMKLEEESLHPLMILPTTHVRQNMQPKMSPILTPYEWCQHVILDDLFVMA